MSLHRRLPPLGCGICGPLTNPALVDTLVFKTVACKKYSNIMNNVFVAATEIETLFSTYVEVVQSYILGILSFESSKRRRFFYRHNLVRDTTSAKIKQDKNPSFSCGPTNLSY